MQKTVSIIIMTLLVVGVMFSCKKDPKSDVTIVTNDTINGIHFGITEGMTVVNQDILLAYDDMWNPIMLDLDNDGTNDIKIDTYYDGPLAIGEYQTLTIRCLNNKTEFLCNMIERDRYHHYDTTYHENNGYTSVFYIYKCNTCEPTGENDVVETYEFYSLLANDKYSLLSAEDNFEKRDFVLFKENVNYTLYSHDNNDSTFYDSKNYVYDCENFPTNVEKYIGFKYTKHNEPRLGWLKLKLVYTNHTVDTRLVETAIQDVEE